jgi:hypothetical protein
MMKLRCGIACLLLPFLGAMAELRSSKNPQIPPKYPIGHVDEPFAKPAGRIFEVNGTAKFLTGTNAWYLNRLDEGDLEITLKQIVEVNRSLSLTFFTHLKLAFPFFCLYF